MKPRYSEGEIDRARGAILGLAVGDALAAPLEWLHPEQIHARYGGDLRDLVVSPGWSRGQWTEETALALELARSIVECEGYDEDDVFARYALYARARPPAIDEQVAFTIGRARNVAEARAAATATAAVGAAVTAGALTRCAPIGVHYSRDTSAIERFSRVDAGLSHADPLAAEACVWFNLTIAELVRGRRPPSSASRVGVATADAIARPEALAGEAQSGGGEVLTILRIAYAAAIGHDTFERAVVFAANLGGDADAAAAAAGALAGARFGVSAIPERWLEPLFARAEITGLATRLLRA